MVVDLPEPFGPSRPTTCPGRAWNVRPFNARTPPYVFVSPVAVNIESPSGESELRG